jgi:integrase
MQPTVAALVRIIDRNYGLKSPLVDPFKGIAIPSNDDYVFRTKSGDGPTSFQKLFESYLSEHNLLIDPKTDQNRVFYSLRHTYATLALTHAKVPIHTLAKQMGTSVQMIEKHYSHLHVVQAIEQLRGEQTRKLIAAAEVDHHYKSTHHSTKDTENKHAAKDG